MSCTHIRLLSVLHSERPSAWRFSGRPMCWSTRERGGAVEGSGQDDGSCTCASSFIVWRTEDAPLLTLPNLSRLAALCCTTRGCTTPRWRSTLRAPCWPTAAASTSALPPRVGAAAAAGGTCGLWSAGAAVGHAIACRSAECHALWESHNKLLRQARVVFLLRNHAHRFILTGFSPLRPVPPLAAGSHHNLVSSVSVGRATRAFQDAGGECAQPTNALAAWLRPRCVVIRAPLHAPCPAVMPAAVLMPGLMLSAGSAPSPACTQAGAGIAWWGVFSRDSELALPPCEFGTGLFFAGSFTNTTKRSGTSGAGSRRLLARQQAVAVQEADTAQQAQQVAPKPKVPKVQKQDLAVGAEAPAPAVPAPAPLPAAGGEGGVEAQWCPGQQWVVQLVAEGARLEPSDLAAAMAQRRRAEGAL